MDDKFLVKRFNDGDEKAFSQLVERHKKAVYAICFRYLGSHQDADEMSQEAFIKAYQNLRGFKCQSAFKTWLIRIAINLCLNEIKRSSRFTELSDIGAEETSDFKSEELKKHIRDAVMTLPDKQRDTVILKAYEGMKYTEIAEVMNCSVGTAKANFHHAMNSLKNKFGNDNE